jgi:hypothetical protein
MSARRRLGIWLMASAAARMRASHPDWAEAMLAEAEMCEGERDRLAWAAGCWMASLREAPRLCAIAYAVALAAGAGLMAAYEWSSDESRVTVCILGLIALVLGAVRPRQAVLSGAVVGLVVAGVIGFEAVSGIRPWYEVRAQTLGDSLGWTILLAPAVCSALLGAQIGRRLGPLRSLR